MSNFISRWLGNWVVCAVFFIVSITMFAILVPRGIAEVTNNRTLAPCILDEYYLTWTRADAIQLLSSLGVVGRQAYQNFYLKLDFWFPVLSLSFFYAGLLSLAFPRPSSFSWLNTLPIAMWLSDAAENLNHFYMAGSYPELPEINLLAGPYLTLVKYLLITFLPVLALAGFVKRAVTSLQR